MLKLFGEIVQGEAKGAITRVKSGISTRKWIAFLCMIALVFTAFPLMSVTAGAGTAIYAKTTDYLNLRSGAGTSYSVKKVIPTNTTVTVTDRSNKDWLKVRLSDGTTGYCSADYLDITTDCTTTDYVNLRSGAGTGYSVVTTISPKTRLDILRFNGSTWAYVKMASGKKGYVCTDYVSYTNTAATTASSTNSDNSSKDTDTASVSPLKLSASTLTIGVDQVTKMSVSGNTGTVKWVTSNISILKVTSSGTIQGVAPGTANVVCTDTAAKVSATCKVTVVKTDFTSIKLSASSKTITAPASFMLTAATNNGSTKVVWKSSDTAVSSVSSSGKVTGKMAGTAIITASDTNGIVKASCKVTVKSNDKITLSKSSATVNVGSSIPLSARLSNASMSVDWISSNTSVAYVRDGMVSGLKAGTATITAVDKSGTISDSCTVTVKSVSSGNVSLSRYSGTVSAGKTLYIQGYNGYNWSTSDSCIATVSNGMINTKMPGKVAISCSDNNGNKAVCVVTVTDAAPVKFVYPSPNSATLNSTIKLIAITDKQRTAVDFYVILSDTKKVRVSATSKVSEGSTYVWTANYKAASAGTYTIKAYANSASGWASCADAVSTIFVSSKTNSAAAGLEKLRPSDGLINFIAEKEGFCSSITYDSIANNVPTLGYGLVVHEGETFYNGLTSREAYAQLVKSVNGDTFASRMNSFLVGNGLRFNQQQFDALVSFSYNLGTGWSYSSDLRDILLRSGGKNLNNVNKDALISEMLAYHHSCGQCYYGLLYRRADELEMFLYGDYISDGRQNKYHFPNPSCISW